jgi:excisionase family DNA binding protein
MTGTASPERQPDLTIAQAAAYRRCCEKTIRRYIAAGLLPATRIGPRMIRVDPRDLDQLARPVAAEVSANA